jgi:AMMECR1 domain-containing protein
VTFYLNGEVRGSAGNIKEIHDSLAKELVSNTMQALTGDKRFTPLTLNEAEKIQFRIDKISDRKMINLADIKNIDPVKN